MVLAHLINTEHPGCPQRSIKNYTIILKKKLKIKEQNMQIRC